MPRTPSHPVRDAELDREFFDGLIARHTGTKDFDVPTMAVWYGLVQTCLMMEARVSLRAQAHGLSLPGLNVLAVLCQHQPDGLPLHELSRYLGVSRANVTGLIDNVVRRGLVRRVDHASDRRSCLAQLTPKGRTWLEHFLPGHFRGIREILEPLSKTDKATLVRLLAQVRTSLSLHKGKE